ncbi:CHAD domain-containing protein [Maribellus mangrovi]|uniref:CHAD domain-containing protein n=1 Tax=Maribellus mangrovi TaxID=3133146 RepID=UPI0030EFA3E1
MDKEQKHRLISVLEGHMFRVEDLCRSEDVSPEIKVHEIRKSFKRINALLRYFPDILKEEVQAFRHPMKDLARLLTMARETTVNLQFFETLCAENVDLALPEAEELKQQLLDENQRSLLEITKGESVFEAIRKQMQSGQHEFLDKLPDSDFSIDIAAELRLSFEKARELFTDSLEEYHPEEYHELRKKMKVLYYQFEFLHPGQVAVPGTLLENLHGITDQLGDDHDWYIFLKEIDEDKYSVSESYRQLLDATIQRYQRSNLELLNQSLTDFFRPGNNAFLKSLEDV